MSPLTVLPAGTPPDAIILGGLLVQGLKIGPSLFNEQGGIVYTFMYGLLIATVLMLPVGLLLGRYAYRTIVRGPKSLLVPAVAFLTVVGSFAIHSNPDDIIIMVALGVMAWLLQRFGFTPSPIVLGLVLGQIAEQGFVQAYLMGSAQNATLQMFFGRPISMAIIAFAVLTLSYPLIGAVWRKAKTKDVAVERTDMVVESASHDEVAVQYRDVPTIVWSVILAALSFAAFAQTKDMSAMGAVFPGTVSVILGLLSLVLIGRQIALPVRPAKGDEKPADEGSMRRRIALIAVLGIWAVLMPKAGFFVTSATAFLILTGLATFERLDSKTTILYGATAMVFVGVFYFIMVNILGLRMPVSWLL